MSATVTCPSCGAHTSGKFCSECGQPLAGRSCASCGAALSARAKFCPECGTPAMPNARGAAGAGGAAGATAGAAPMPGLGNRFPWIIAGLAVLALVTTIVVVITKRDAPAGPGATAAGSFDPTNRPTTDLSSMTPREAADRLYERVARAAAQGDTAQVSFFAPMAIQAYANVTPLDADARLHLGLIQLNAGNPAAAVAQADSIARSNPTHLFAAALRAQAATAQSNTAAARQAYQTFLRNYDSEVAKNLPEYQQHQALLDEMRNTAREAGGTRS